VPGPEHHILISGYDLLEWPTLLRSLDDASPDFGVGVALNFIR
jgi:hypothetical protein